MVDLFDEINEELKQERLFRILNKYLPHIMVVVTIIAIAVASMVAWDKHVRNKQEQLGDMYYKAILSADTGSVQEALTALDYIITQKYGKGLPALAALKKAAILNKEGKFKEALEIYDHIWQDTATDSALRELAGLIALTHLIEKADNEAEINQRLDSINGIKGPFTQLINLTKAVWLLKRNDKEAALKLLKSINHDSKTPYFLREEVSALITILTERGDNKF